MKKPFLLLILSVLILSGCKKDNGDPSPADFETLIIGKWYIKKTYEKEFVNGVKLQDETRTDYGIDDFFEFKKNGDATNNDKDDFFTYVIVDNKLKLYDKDDPADPDPEYEYTIITLTKDDLVLLEGMDDGAGVNSYTQEFTMKKKY